METRRFKPRRGLSVSSSPVSSPWMRSAETISIRAAISVIAFTTSGATRKPSREAKRAARSILKGSSENEISGVDGVRSTPSARSPRPP